MPASSESQRAAYRWLLGRLFGPPGGDTPLLMADLAGAIGRAEGLPASAESSGDQCERRPQDSQSVGDVRVTSVVDAGSASIPHTAGQGKGMAVSDGTASSND